MDNPSTLVRDLKLRELRIALRVAQCGGILKAATELNLSQPAVTRTIRELELKLGVALFERTSKGVSLTPYGEVFLNRAAAVFGEIRSVELELQQLKTGTQGIVKVGAMPMAAASVVSQAISDLLRSDPGLEFSVFEAPPVELTRALREREIDFAVGRLPGETGHRDFEHELLMYDTMRIVVREGHPLASVQRPKLQQLSSWSWLLPPPGTPVYELIAAEFRSRGFQPPKVAASTLSLLILQRLAANSDCITLLPDAMVRFGMLHGSLMPLRIKLPNTAGPIGITRLAGRNLMPTSLALVEALRNLRSD